MKHILATGGEGFVGSHVVKRLRASGDLVTSIDIKSGNDFKDYRFDPDVDPMHVVVHCAASVSVTEGEELPEQYIHNNLTKLSIFLKNLPKDVFFVFLSTGGALYGNQSNAREEKASLDHCTNVYAMTKLAGEWLVRHTLPDSHLILRLGNVHGDGEDSRGEKNCFTHFKEDNPIVLYGDPTRDIVDIETVVSAIEFGIHNNIVGTYNISDGKPTNITKIAEQYAFDRKVKLIRKPRRKGEVDSITLDVNKARGTGLL